MFKGIYFILLHIFMGLLLLGPIFIFFGTFVLNIFLLFYLFFVTALIVLPGTIGLALLNGQKKIFGPKAYEFYKIEAPLRSRLKSRPEWIFLENFSNELLFFRSIFGETQIVCPSAIIQTFNKEELKLFICFCQLHSKSLSRFQAIYQTFYLILRGPINKMSKIFFKQEGTPYLLNMFFYPLLDQKKNILKEINSLLSFGFTRKQVESLFEKIYIFGNKKILNGNQVQSWLSKETDELFLFKL